MYEKLPQELKERGSFCLWKYEERDGRMTKVPYQTSGLRADSTNKATFTDFFLGMVRKYTDITELSAEIIRSFVERIEVLQPEKVPGTRTKKHTIVIYWNFIGAIEIPDGQEKTA